MSDTELTTIVRRIGGRDRVLRIRLGEMGELETLCNAGIGEIYLRVATQRYRIADLRETIRLGLIGGGCAPPEADLIVSRYVDDRPISEYLQIAADVLVALHSGAKAAADESEADDAGKADGSGGPATSPLSSQPGSSQASDQTTSVA